MTVGNIGYKWQSGDQAYIRPAYLNTYDWQVMYMDFQSDYYKSDAWYFVWFWYADALFPIEIEIDYIAMFADMDTAEAYVKQRGHDVEPEIITEEVDTEEPPATEETVETAPETSPVIKPQTAQRTEDQTQKPQETSGQSNVENPEEPTSSIGWIVVAAAVVVVAIVVVIVIKKKKA